MKVNKQIRFSEDLMHYRMDMLNGTVVVPKMPGAYNIATGCGSGKTTIIKQVIEQKYNYGIIVFCKTIRECNELYDYTVNFIDNFNWNQIYDDDMRLHKDEVINLCSEPRIEEINGKRICTNGVNLNWKDNLDMIGNRKVVIATHSVLMNTPLDKLMVLNSQPSPASMFERGLAGVNGRLMIRQFMMIDELILNEPIKKTFNLSGMMAFMNVNTALIPDPESPNGLKEITVFKRKLMSSYGQFILDYKMAQNIDSSYRFDNKSTELNEARIDMIKSTLYHTMDVKANTASMNAKDKITVKYNLPSMLMTGGINTNIWMFEGTGDITLSTSILYRCMSYPNKYSGENVDVIKIPNYLKSRNVDMDKMFSKKDEVLSNINKNIELLENIIKCNNETLIIVWKNLRAKYVTGDKEYTENLAKYIMNDEFNLAEYYKSRLEGRLIGTGHKFHVIHYGSGLDLATNEFRNCDSIVRLGLFQIPNDALSDINDSIGTEMNMKKFILYQNIQALSRTHLRLHEGKKVRFYISEDYGNNIDTLSGYLTNEGVNVARINLSLDCINKKVLDKLQVLFEYDENIMKCIISMTPYELTLTLDEINNIIPMTKEIRKYKNIVTELRNLGIVLNII